MSEPLAVYVYGYGGTKHIKDANREDYGRDEWGRGEWGLCGAPGGHPLVRDHLPVCKRCAKKFAFGVMETPSEKDANAK